jgi:hypothetical protein
VLTLDFPFGVRLGSLLQEKIKMVATENAEKPAARKTQSAPEGSNDKFAEARKAKKKQKRARHRLTIKRSNTGG